MGEVTLNLRALRTSFWPACTGGDRDGFREYDDGLGLSSLTGTSLALGRGVGGGAVGLLTRGFLLLPPESAPTCL